MIEVARGSETGTLEKIRRHTQVDYKKTKQRPLAANVNACVCACLRVEGSDYAFMCVGSNAYVIVVFAFSFAVLRERFCPPNIIMRKIRQTTSRKARNRAITPCMAVQLSGPCKRASTHVCPLPPTHAHAHTHM